MMKHPDQLVSAAELEGMLGDENLRIYDCTTYLLYETGSGKPYTVKAGLEDYEAGHIPGSAFIDLQGQLSVTDSPFRFTVPPANDLARRFGELGIGPDSRVVLYSRANMQWATRIWWMLRYVGFDNAAILDGGWEKWTHDRRAVETTATVYPPATLTAQPRPDLFVGREEMLASIEDTGLCALNALGEDLHRGENARYGRPGRIPGSVNVPAVTLQHPETKEFVSLEMAAQQFKDAGIDRDQRVLVYCGGGIAATLDAYLLHQLGYENIAVYDNSMSEWSTDDSLPIETG